LDADPVDIAKELGIIKEGQLTAGAEGQQISGPSDRLTFTRIN
jgi:hypothetical protein